MNLRKGARCSSKDLTAVRRKLTDKIHKYLSCCYQSFHMEWHLGVAPRRLRLGRTIRELLRKAPLRWEPLSRKVCMDTRTTASIRVIKLGDKNWTKHATAFPVVTPVAVDHSLRWKLELYMSFDRVATRHKVYRMATLLSDIHDTVLLAPLLSCGQRCQCWPWYLR